MRFSSLLIANRGEIACRIIRSAREKGLRTIAVFSEADRDALHVRLADNAVYIGPALAAHSYLNIEAILDAAQRSGAEAIHPGYGFLSERADFANAVEKAGLVFVGPPPFSIEAMGDKAQAKRIMIEAGVPCVPGYEGEDQSEACFIKAAENIGYPIMVKASAGGGGRGMRQVFEAKELTAAIDLAKSEAANAFGNDKLILEKLVLKPRHVEIQVFADSHGNIIHMGERDCSVQRRHQKVIEEAPSPIMDEALRQRMGEAAVNAARAVNYRGAGTVEFLVDESEAFYFLEMNTRIQVEHPVTELVTDTDLVSMQLDVAMGEALQIDQDDVSLIGHAMEVRLYAENPAKGFLPDSGKILAWEIPASDGIRLDSAVEMCDTVSTHYDPMLAKLISHGRNRQEAIAKLIAALKRSTIAGFSTNQTFLIDLLSDETFVAGKATTALLEDKYPDGYTAPPPDTKTMALGAALYMHIAMLKTQKATRLAAGFMGWSSATLPPRDFAFELDGQLVNASVRCSKRTSDQNQIEPATILDWSVNIEEQQHIVTLEHKEENTFRVQMDEQNILNVTAIGNGKNGALEFTCGGIRNVLKPVSSAKGALGDASSIVMAPMPGTLIEIKVGEGDRVEKNQAIAVLEAMKMQHPLTVSVSGTVKAVLATQGQQLVQDQLIVELEADAEQGA